MVVLKNRQKLVLGLPKTKKQMAKLRMVASQKWRVRQKMEENKGNNRKNRPMRKVQILRQMVPPIQAKVKNKEKKMVGSKYAKLERKRQQGLEFEKWVKLPKRLY